MTADREPRAPDVVAELATEAIEAMVRRDRPKVERILDVVMREGDPADSLRFCMGIVVLIAEMLPPSEKAMIAAGQVVPAESAPHPAGELLFLQLLSEVIRGEVDAAMERFVEALVADVEDREGAPGWVIGTALRLAANMVRQSRARLQ